MSNAIITVESVGKKYRISHRGERPAYVSLRDVVAQKCAAPFRTLFGKNGRKDALLGGVPDSSHRNGAAPASTEDFWALKDISFEVKQGEVVGIIGGNGAGKSTVLKILSRITEPSEGRVTLRGRVASLLEVGTGFHPELTGRENVFLNGAILGMSRAEIRMKFDEIVSFAEVEKFLDTPVKRYSSGMYVRLAFAVAAHLEPEILIIDEVLAVGDAAFQSKCLGKMGQVARQGRTVIFVSHNMSAVVELCSRAILLKKARLALDTDVSKVVSAYLGEAIVSANGEFDLTKHPSRSLQSRSIIRKMRLCKNDGTSSAYLFPEEECIVEIEYEFKESVQDPRWALSIEDFQGRRIMTFASFFQENHVSGRCGRGRVQCSIGSLALGTGRYLLSVSISDKTMGMLESLDNAAWFEVLWNSNFKDGEPYNPVYGPVLQQSKWTDFRGE